MKVVVTGSAGMLGSSIVRQLESSKDKKNALEVRPLTREEIDLTDRRSWEEFVRDEAPDCVVHAAAKVGGIQANIDNPFGFLRENVVIDSNVIGVCAENQIPKLLYIGSSCMYPKLADQPLKERSLLSGVLEPTNEGYALAKLVGIKLCEFASTTFGVSYRSVIPSNLYGPGDDFNPRRSHLMSAIIRKAHEAKVNEEPSVSVWGTGRARRELTYVGDLANWVVGQLDSLEELPYAMNVGSGIDYSVEELYLAVLQMLEVKASLCFDPTIPDGMDQKLLDSSTAKEHHGWSPSTDLGSGVRQTYRWALEEGIL